jgi:polysaccharide biosynthesis transport protein
VVTATEVGTSDVVDISATEPSPAFATRLANVYAREAITFQMNTARAGISQVRNSLQAQLSAMTPAEQASDAGTSLKARISQLDTLAAAQTGQGQLIQPATPPTSPSSPKTKLDIAVGALLGLLFGIGLALLLERLNRQIRTVEELSEILGYPLLAEIPEQAGLRGEASDIDPYGHNSIEMLQARLRYFNVDSQLRTLLVTSCAPQEGKTTVAWHLAQVSTLSGRGRVLLLEADLRRPSLAVARGLFPGPGLSDVLAGDCGYEQAIQQVRHPRTRTGSAPEGWLDVIVAGAAPPNPAELIDSARMRDLLQELSGVYDFIVVDCGPALAVPDPLVLMSQVDGVLVISRVGSIERNEATALRDELRSARAPVVGFVANRVKSSMESRYYHSYSSYVAPDAERTVPPPGTVEVLVRGKSSAGSPSARSGQQSGNRPPKQSRASMSARDRRQRFK